MRYSTAPIKREVKRNSHGEEDEREAGRTELTEQPRMVWIPIIEETKDTKRLLKREGEHRQNKPTGIPGARYQQQTDRQDDCRRPIGE